MVRAKDVGWNDEHRLFVRDNIKGVPYKDMRDMVNAEFGLNVTTSQMQGFITRNGFANGNKTTFSKGRDPWNKNVKGLQLGGDAGWFKKGHRPSTYRPVGSHRIDSKDGYLKIKVSDHGRTQDMWKNKHVVLWEEAHGKIPDQHVVCFLDQDVTNLNLNNLFLLSRNELARMNQFGLFSTNPELTMAGITLTRLRLKVRDVELKGGDLEKFQEYIEMAEAQGIQEMTFIARVERGWSIHDAIHKPLNYRFKKGG